MGNSETPLSSTTTTFTCFAARWTPLLALGRTRLSSCSFSRFCNMTRSDSVHVFDECAENVISISSYIKTVGLFSNRPLSMGL